MIEGDIFKTIIPLVAASEKKTNDTNEKKRAIIAHLEEFDQATAADFAEIFELSKERKKNYKKNIKFPCS